MIRALALALVIPATAQAACKGETVVSCPVGGGDVLEVCATGGGFTYAFGPPGAPELHLSVPYAAGTVTPWPGVGRAIWSTVGFPNAGYIYEVWTSVERDPGAPEVSAGVNVWQGEALVADFTCAPGTADAAAFTLEDIMAAAGFVWDLDRRVWR